VKAPHVMVGTIAGRPMQWWVPTRSIRKKALYQTQEKIYKLKKKHGKMLKGNLVASQVYAL